MLLSVPSVRDWKVTGGTVINGQGRVFVEAEATILFNASEFSDHSNCSFEQSLWTDQAHLSVRDVVTLSSYDEVVPVFIYERPVNDSNPCDK